MTVVAVKDDIFQQIARLEEKVRRLEQSVTPSIWARVHSAVAHSAITNGSANALSFDTVDFDQGGLYDASHPTRLIAPVTGLYIASAAVALNTTAAGRIIPRFVLNSSVEIGRGSSIVSGGAESNPTMIANLTQGYYLEFNLWNLSGSSTTPANGGGLTWFAMALVSLGGV